MVKVLLVINVTYKSYAGLIQGCLKLEGLTYLIAPLQFYLECLGSLGKKGAS